MSQPAEYDAITEAYQNSKRLPFREYVERYTLFDLLGKTMEAFLPGESRG